MCLPSLRIFFFFKVAHLPGPGCSQVMFALENPGLHCLLSFLFRSDFYHFFLFVPPQVDTQLVCHLPAVLTYRCCFPALRETKLLGFCGACHWTLCNFYFYFLAWSALEAFFWWGGLCILLAGTSVHLPSCSSSSARVHPQQSHKHREATGYFIGTNYAGRGCFPKYHPLPTVKINKLFLIISKQWLPQERVC